MSQWRIESLGITSEDLNRRDAKNDTSASHGNTWRFAHESPETMKQKPVAKKVDVPLMDNKPLDNYLVDEAKAMGLPISQPDRAAPSETLDETAQALEDAINGSTPKNSAPKLTKEVLTKMSKEEVVELAAGAGIANLEQTKGKLIELILEKNK